MVMSSGTLGGVLVAFVTCPMVSTAPRFSANTNVAV